MKLLKRLLIILCMIGLLTLPAFAEDCHELTDSWFGPGGSDGSVLGLDTVDTEPKEMADLLDVYFSGRAGAFTEDAVAMAAGDCLYSAGDDRIRLIAELEDRIDAVITDANVSSFITELEETDTGYVATVYEWTFFDYDDLADGVGGSDTAGFGVEHTITFAYNASGSLEIVSDEYTESDVLTGVIDYDSADMELVADEEATADTLSAVTFDADFDVVKASIYANKWVSQENTDELIDSSYYNTDEYNNWNPGGGDCANYVSQCMYAGNFDTTSTWYKNSGAWIACPKQFNYLKNYGTVVYNPTEADVYPGAPLYFSNYSSTSSTYFYHVIICTGHNSAGTPVVNGHNYDRYRMPWNYSEESIRALIQLTEYEVEQMAFGEDYIVAYQDVRIPLYSHYISDSSIGSMTLNKGDRYAVVTGFVYNGQQWFAYDYSGTIYYGKITSGTYLTSQTPDMLLTCPESVTTNDYLTVTASIPNDEVSSAEATFTDANGVVQTVTMTCADGIASATVDCQDFAAGSLTVTVECSGAVWTNLMNSVSVTVTAEDTVSSYDGETLLWTLDKTTGELVIMGPETVTSADYLRFADKIVTVTVSPAVAALPQDPLSGCTALATVYGSQPGLEDAAEALGAEFILMYFWDVAPTDWAYAEINTAYENGLVNGTGDNMFSPTVTMNRGSFVTILGRMAGIDEDYSGKTTFKDLEDTYYTGAVIWAAEKGIITGITPTVFAPNDTITREQAATIISRYLDIMDIVLPDVAAPAHIFSDMDQVGDWAQEHVDILRLKGIINGRGNGAFDPKAQLTRQEATALLVRVHEAAANLPD